MNQKIIAALIVLGVAAFWARSAFAKSATATTAGVDRDARLNASPVKGGAAVEQVSGARVTTPLRFGIPSGAFQQPFRLQPQAYSDSKYAAYTAPIFVRDTPSSRLTTY